MPRPYPHTPRAGHALKNEYPLNHLPYDSVPSADPIIPPPKSCLVYGVWLQRFAGAEIPGWRWQHGLHNLPTGCAVPRLFEPTAWWNDQHALLDAAMTHCLFRQGIEAVTASLKVRFVEPIPHATPLNIRARHQTTSARVLPQCRNRHIRSRSSPCRGQFHPKESWWNGAIVRE